MRHFNHLTLVLALSTLGVSVFACSSSSDNTGTAGKSGGAGQAAGAAGATGGAAGATGGAAGETGGAAGETGGAAGETGGAAGETGGAAGETGGAAGETGGAGGSKACTTGDECKPGVCDPASLTCVTGCVSPDDCANPQTETCVAQYSEATAGACYPTCVAYTTACANASQTCVPSDLGMTEGYCAAPGSKGIGADCDMLAASTDCVSGSFCGNVSKTESKCIEMCNYFGASASCTNGAYCSYGGWCWAGVVATAKLGETCAAADDEKDCAMDNGIARGICLAAEQNGPITCLKFCRIDGTDCEQGKTCEDIGAGTLGICF